MNTNRQFIKLNDNHGDQHIIPTCEIILITPSVAIKGSSIQFKTAGTWSYKETPEEIYAMLEPYQPAALLDEYEKLANIATDVKFRLTEVLCKHIPSHIKVNSAALANDVEIVCEEITGLAYEAKRKANN